jgi:hypothetical protein
MDLNRSTYHFIEIRYTLLAAPALYLIISAGIFTGKYKEYLNCLLPFLITIFLFFQIPKAYTPYKENWFEMAEVVQKSKWSNDIVILPVLGEKWQAYWPKFIWTALSYYFYSPDRRMILISKPLSNQTMEEIGWSKGAWILTHIPEFSQSASMEWPQQVAPGSRVDAASLVKDCATIFHVTLPDRPPEARELK